MAEKSQNSGFCSRRSFLSAPFKVLALASLILLMGCDEDKRTGDEKASQPAPEYATRYVMQCPKCGAPTAPYAVNGYKNFYRCSGQPPKFAYHSEKEWSRRLNTDGTRDEK
jgi:hypothetical protein